MTQSSFKATTQTADESSEWRIQIELLRRQLQAVADESADTVERTAISPIVTEGQDYGSVILNADGGLLAGGGQASLHWIGATRAVRATIEKYGDTIADGDVYLANDPHNGGGMHPSDVMVQRPIFVDGVLVGWSALSAHLMDMGGMAVGSWSTQATDCYQEALRIPPVRLVKEGVELSDVWDLFRTNVRFAELVEMDLRGLIAGSFVAMRKLRETVEAMGVEVFRDRVAALIELTAAEMVNRIRKLEPGDYVSTGWIEWGEEFIATPCKLTVGNDKLIFDFEGAPEQIPFFINSKPYIITTLFMPLLTALLAPDLPYNEGLMSAIELRCPVGSVVNSTPPAPGNCGHMHLGQTAAETMNQCMRLAVWSSPKMGDFERLAGYDGQSAHAPNTYWGVDREGNLDAWMMLDGLMVGQSASPNRDGIDYADRILDLPNRPASQPTPLDVESYESWYPVLIEERKLQVDTWGVGRWRSGASLSYRFTPWNTDEISGQMLGYRGRIPLPGIAGGRPGSVAAFELVGTDGSVRPITMAEPGLVVRKGESFVLRNASGGGWGDPLERDPEAVALDVEEGRLTSENANEAYGVVLVEGQVDAESTAKARSALRIARLAAAEQAPMALQQPALPAEDLVAALPLCVGVVQYGSVAYASGSGAALALSPGNWTDGCPRTVELLEERGIVIRTYLDPLTGASLYADVMPAGVNGSFETRPDRWTTAANVPA